MGLTQTPPMYGWSPTSGWDVSTAVYDNKSFSVSGEESGTQGGLFFKSDGTKMYIVGLTNDTVYQYTLSTPWDVSTASYDSKSFDASSQETQCRGVSFKDDGTKMYIIGSANDTVYQYTLSTPWDVSTASYDSKSLDVSTHGWQNVVFKSDGSKLYVLSGFVHQYSLSTPWDISTASYDNKSFEITEDTGETGFFIKPDGTKLYVVCDSAPDTVYQYTLSTAWDVSTASYDSKSFDVSAQASSSAEIFFKGDGTKMYIISSDDNVYQYSVGG